MWNENKFREAAWSSVRGYLPCSKHLLMVTVFLCFLICLNARAHAQSYGSAVGTVTDNAGAVVVGAKVTLSNVDTGDTRSMVTNRAGDYEFVSILPGNYSISIETAGFKRFTQRSVIVQVQVSTRVNASLAVGDVSQNIEVSSDAPLVETQQATVGQVVAGRAVTELPLNGRNVFNLLAITPGVVPQGGTSSSNAAAANAGNSFGTGNYQIAGGIPNTGTNFVDGAPINNGYINAIAYIPAQDSIQEFKVEANNVGPEFGGTTNGVVSMVTKSGTNAFHGSVYDFLRNTVLNANTFYANRNGLKKPPFIQNQFGGTVGGPIKRDKLFFFFSYEGVRAAVGSTSTYSVPTALERTGNFSELTLVNPFDKSNTLADPGSFNAAGTVFTPAPAGTIFQNKQIPASRFDTAATALLNLWPAPTQLGLTNNYTTNLVTHPSLNQYIARMDYNLSARQRLFGRYTYHKYGVLNALPYGVINNPSVNRNAVQNFVIGDNITINPTTILNVDVSYFRDTGFSGNTGIPFDLSFTTWPTATLAQINAPVLPSIVVSGYSNNGGAGQQIPANEEIYTVSGTATKILGRHTLFFGGEARREPNNYSQTNNSINEIFNFNTSFTDASFASYLLGLPQKTQTQNVIKPAAMLYYYGAFLGDTFQVSSKLTVVAGLRWENPGLWTERHDRQAVFLPGETNPLNGVGGLNLTGNVELVNTSAYPYRTNLKPHYLDFSPRVGFTYSFTPKTVFRSGFGLLYAPTGSIQQNAQPYQSPVNNALTVLAASGSTPVNALHNPFPTGILQPVGRSANYQSVILGQTVVVSIPDAHSTYVEQWNADLQQNLGHDTLMDIAYVGSYGLHQQGPAGLNDNGQGLDQIPDQYDSMGTALTNLVPNPFAGKFAGGSINGPTVPAGQLLRPYPQYFDIHNPATAQYFSKYNGLQTKLQKRFGGGGTLLATYTWARNYGNADTQTGFQEGVQPGMVQDWYNLHAEVSQLSYNVPHRAVISYVLDLPVGRGGAFLPNVSGFADRAISGWGLDGITSFQSGFPLILTAQPTTLNSVFGAGTPRPNVVAGCTKQAGGSAFSRSLPGATWFNPTCFTQPGNFSFGNEPRVDPSLRQQGIANWDFALFKSTTITEQVKVQFRAEMFNSFNRVQFGYPAQLLASNFGVISSQANSPRQIQFALRINY